jgi:hypothetical protein
VTEHSPKVGDTIWIFDANRRTYAKDARGCSVGGPIWREHWRPEKITGENSRSWVIGIWDKTKIPKKGPWHGVAFSQAEIERAAFVHDHAYKIAEAVRRLGYDDLIKVAEIVGYAIPQHPAKGGE